MAGHLFSTIDFPPSDSYPMIAVFRPAEIGNEKSDSAAEIACGDDELGNLSGQGLRGRHSVVLDDIVLWIRASLQDIAGHRKIPRNDDFGRNFREMAGAEFPV
jgi:hypothetical protein